MRHYRSSDSLWSVAFVVWLIGMLISLTISGAIIYVAYHFISKYW